MTSRAADIRELAVAGLASVAGAILAPGVEFLGVPLAAAGLGWLAYRRGYAAAAAVAVLATIVVALLAQSMLPVAFIGPVLLVAGPGVAWALTRWQAQNVIALLSIVVTLAAIGFSAIMAFSAGTSLFAQLATEAAGWATRVLTWSTQSSIRSGAAQKLAEQVRSTVLMMWPSGYFYDALVAAIFAVPLVSRAGRALGRTVSRLPVLPEFDVSPHVVWPTIAGIGCLAAAIYQARPTGVLAAVGANLLLIVRPALFFQGMANFAALYRKAGVGRLSRVFGFTFLTLSELVIPSVSVIGLADVFVNLRKLHRRGDDATTAAA